MPLTWKFLRSSVLSPSECISPTNLALQNALLTHSDFPQSSYSVPLLLFGTPDIMRVSQISLVDVLPIKRLTYASINSTTSYKIL